MNNAEACRRYYAAHREELAEKRRARYHADPNRHKAKSKEWRDANKDRLRDYNAQWRQDNREHLLEYSKTNRHRWASSRRQQTRRYDLKSKYGLTPDQYREMLIGQAGRCLICLRVPDKTLVVDHDHATGKVRGLLCNRCNRLLGIASDHPGTLESAIRYLEMAR